MWWWPALIFTHLIAAGLGAIWYKHLGYDLDSHDDNRLYNVDPRSYDPNNPAGLR